MRPRGTDDQAADERLMSRFERRDVTAVEELFLRFGAIIFGIGLRTLHDADLASALVEGTFVRLWRGAPRYPSGGVPLDRWVLTHALGLSLQMSRSRCAGSDTGGSMQPCTPAVEPVPV